MDITLLDDMQKHNKNDLPNWIRIQQLMPNSFSNTDLLDYSQSHESTKPRHLIHGFNIKIRKEFRD